ncbi:MAG: polysaccharide deacetylase family protein [Thermodesulfobacteriota bacterium]|nr:polysaccharide deacetylase family protein [Thermodesulfobacteriota bacterium]
MDPFVIEKLRRFSLRVLALVGKLNPFHKRMILAYHSVDPTGSLISVHPDVFRQQMEYLRESGKKAVSFGEYLNHYSAFRPEPSNVVALIFDDGFDNFHRVALPVLLKHGFSATVFVVTGYVGSNCTWEKTPDIPDLRLMDWIQLRECHEQGIEIGSHTIDHFHLTGLEQAEMSRQIAGSKARIEDSLKVETTSFCYPYGDYDDNVVNLVRKAGYRAAVTCRFEYDHPGRNPYESPRVGMNRVNPTDHVAQRLYLQAGLGGMLHFYENTKGFIWSRREKPPFFSAT